MDHMKIVCVQRHIKGCQRVLLQRQRPSPGELPSFAMDHELGDTEGARIEPQL